MPPINQVLCILESLSTKLCMELSSVELGAETFKAKLCPWREKAAAQGFVSVTEVPLTNVLPDQTLGSMGRSHAPSSVPWTSVLTSSHRAHFNVFQCTALFLSFFLSFF